MTLPVPQKRNQLGRLRGRIVDPRNQTVLETDAPPGLFEIVGTGIQHIAKRIAIRNRHEVLSCRIVRCVQGQRKRHLQLFVGKTPYLRHQTAGRYRDISLGNV